MVVVMQMLYEYITHDAPEKMKRRSLEGHQSSNILEYRRSEVVYVTTDADGSTSLVRAIPEGNPHTPPKDIGGNSTFRIYDLIRTPTFRTLLLNFVKQQGPEIVAVIWYPGNDKNVIEIVWGYTEYHQDAYKGKELVIVKTSQKFTTNGKRSENISDGSFRRQRK